jgi:small subunit ribosomal protein S21
MSKKQKQHQQIVPGNALAVSVVGTEMYDLTHALKAWKRKVKAANILNIVKERKEYIKPSVIQRDQKSKASYIQRIRSKNEN